MAFFSDYYYYYLVLRSCTLFRIMPHSSASKTHLTKASKTRLTKAKTDSGIAQAIRRDIKAARRGNSGRGKRVHTSTTAMLLMILGRNQAAYAHIAKLQGKQ